VRTTSGYDWIWFPTRLAIYARDSWTCLACCHGAGEKRLERLSLDHVLPTSLGGGNKPANLITLCVSCNSERGARLLAEWRSELVAVAACAVRLPLDRAAARELAMELRPGRILAGRARKRRPPLELDVPF
jgi:hypothetical protein